MLSDEEKEEALSETEIRFRADLLILNSEFPTHRKTEAMEELLEIYNKQSKEIEELKDKNKKLQDKAKELIFEKQELTSALLDSIPNDKIKAKIEELDEKIKVKKEIAKNPMDRVSERLLTDNIVELEKTKKVLQSLLEKE